MKTFCVLLVLFCAFVLQTEAQSDTLATVHMADIVVEANASSASDMPLVLLRRESTLDYEVALGDALHSRVYQPHCATSDTSGHPDIKRT